MTRKQSEEERCAEAKKFDRIAAAFQAGDLAALRAAVDDPSLIPNGHLHDAIGWPLVYAIYWSPLAFIRTLLEAGADPNIPVADGIPPLIAAIVKTRHVPGSMKRDDVDEVIRLLLKHGADPNQRGINDYTALHMAVAERNALAVQILLDGGADPELQTRIDECETALQMAESANLTEIAAILARKGKPEERRLRSGLTRLWDVPGQGEEVRRQHAYHVRLRMWLNDGDPVRWTLPSGPVGVGRLEDAGATLITDMFINRGQMMNGLFYGVEGMRIGGTRRLRIAPHLAYGDRGIPGVIPSGAVLTAEITVLKGPMR